MRRTARGGVWAVGAAAAMSLLSGCVTHADETVARPTSGPRSSQEKEPQQALDIAEQLLERDCMRRHGFKFWVVPRAVSTMRRDFPYVVDDVGWARVHGYGADQYAALQRADESNPNKHYLWSLRPERRTALLAALNGSHPRGLTVDLPNGARVSHSDQGCTAEAERSLYGDLPAWFRATRTTTYLAGERVAAVQQDPQYLAARDRWARCMKAAGLPYADPQESRAAADPEKGVSRAREIRLAVAEATCAVSTGLSREASALDRSNDARLRKRYPAVYSDLARMKAAAMPRARALVDRG
ncbi:hypothetical protein QFZ75_001215 [Streptomyces sp. V3I8]|uniref:hypothetical protein n=1 Tax=Streptomyces sp. V3I8 TaxID=3042279 RepID=UPI002784D099|nr:hypothetical protein [Streptomyces sp. V3I8]MDQ1034799.1 hypothetical protein [Streptomyces sp. V3I8]